MVRAPVPLRQAVAVIGRTSAGGGFQWLGCVACRGIAPSSAAAMN